MVGGIGGDEANVAPAVPERLEVRRAVSAVGVEDHRNLANAQAGVDGVSHHLGRELHAGRAHLHALVRLGGEGTHSAMEVTDWGVNGNTSDQREDWVPYI